MEENAANVCQRVQAFTSHTVEQTVIGGVATAREEDTANVCGYTRSLPTQCGANRDRSGQASEEDAASVYGYTHTLVHHAHTVGEGLGRPGRRMRHTLVHHEHTVGEGWAGQGGGCGIHWCTVSTRSERVGQAREEDAAYIGAPCAHGRTKEWAAPAVVASSPVPPSVSDPSVIRGF